MELDVVVCSKNRAEMLERVLRQIIREIPFRKLIVIYASSEDRTKEVAEKYTKEVFWDEERGLGAARNLGIVKASSELVAMIDDDVILTKDWYERLVPHFRDPKVAAVMGTSIYGYGFLPVQRLFEYWRLERHEDWGCMNTVFNRDVVLKIGNFDETIRGAGEDYDLYKRISSAGFRWVWDRTVVVWHPLTLSEYLAHLRWWNKGKPIISELVVQVRTFSLFRVYSRFAFSILESFRESARLSVRVHPTLLLLRPLFQAVSTFTQLKEMKKMLNDSQ